MSTIETEKLALALEQISSDKEALQQLNDMLSNATREKIMNLSMDLIVKNRMKENKEEN